jgi:HIT zinc finger
MLHIPPNQSMDSLVDYSSDGDQKNSQLTTNNAQKEHESSRELSNQEFSLVGGNSLTCQVCKVIESKYTCPGCSVRFCSISCNKSHKDLSKCSGNRNRTSFIPLSNFNENNLISDQSFLAEVAASKDQSKRIIPKKIVASNSSRLPSHWYQFLQAALSRGVHLKLMPKGMARHDVNTSKFVRDQTSVIKSDINEEAEEGDSIDQSGPISPSNHIASLSRKAFEGRLYWRVEVTIYCLDNLTLNTEQIAAWSSTSTLFVEPCISEDETMMSLLQRALLGKYDISGDNMKICLLYKHPYKEDNLEVYSIIDDHSMSVQQVLSQKHVIEFPHMVVVVSPCDNYQLLSDAVLKMFPQSRKQPDLVDDSASLVGKRSFDRKSINKGTNRNNRRRNPPYTSRPNTSKRVYLSSKK